MSYRFAATADHPLIRGDTVCPFCVGFKDRGLVACWDCYHSVKLKYGNPVAEEILNERERRLAKEGF